ncbi:MAG: prepilin peptidase [Candidatus Rokubacteria bacterium]|nr:prepilin peptidase [Candidatus Rokubacteria bacterium]
MLPRWFVLALIIWLGLWVGSFLNVVIYRVPRGESVVKPRSRCPRCGTMIRWYQNLPLLSFVLLRGRCAYCGVGISWRYPLVEAVTTLFFVLTYLTIGLGVRMLLVWFLVSALLAIFFIDLDFGIIPDRITLPGIALGLAFAALTPGLGWVEGALGSVAGAWALWLVAFIGDVLFKERGVRGADIKLAAMVGAFMGWDRLVATLLAASVLALVWLGVSTLLLRGKVQRHATRVGPYVSIAALVTFLFGDRLIRF